MEKILIKRTMEELFGDYYTLRNVDKGIGEINLYAAPVLIIETKEQEEELRKRLEDKFKVNLSSVPIEELILEIREIGKKAIEKDLEYTALQCALAMVEEYFNDINYDNEESEHKPLRQFIGNDEVAFLVTGSNDHNSKFENVEGFYDILGEEVGGITKRELTEEEFLDFDCVYFEFEVGKKSVKDSKVINRAISRNEHYRRMRDDDITMLISNFTSFDIDNQIDEYSELECEDFFENVLPENLLEKEDLENLVKKIKIKEKLAA